jgi:hypothetical protein
LNPFPKIGFRVLHSKVSLSCRLSFSLEFRIKNVLLTNAIPMKIETSGKRQRISPLRRLLNQLVLIMIFFPSYYMWG